MYRPLGDQRVYLPLGKMADTPFHIQGEDMSTGQCQTGIVYLT